MEKLVGAYSFARGVATFEQKSLEEVAAQSPEDLRAVLNMLRRRNSKEADALIDKILGIHSI